MLGRERGSEWRVGGREREWREGKSGGRYREGRARLQLRDCGETEGVRRLPGGGEEGEGWWGPQGQNRLFIAQLMVAGWKTRRSVTEEMKVELGVK